MNTTARVSSQPLLVTPTRALRGVLLVILLSTPAISHGAPDSPAGEGQTTGWPLSPAPTVVTGFSPPTARWGAGHRGVDLLGAAGQTVHAPREGTVAFVGTVAGTPVVSIDHPDGTRTTYQPVATAMQAGTGVRRGQPFGLLLPARSHCAPALCLHWGLRRGDEYLDPLTLVSNRRVRLLPLRAPAGASGPGMGLPVGRAQTLGAHVGVQLGGRQR